MTLHQATEQAIRRAKSESEWRYVVWSNESEDLPGQHYHVASEEMLGQYYNGCNAILAVGPDGTVEP